MAPAACEGDHVFKRANKSHTKQAIVHALNTIFTSQSPFAFLPGCC